MGLEIRRFVDFLSYLAAGIDGRYHMYRQVKVTEDDRFPPDLAVGPSPRQGRLWANCDIDVVRK